MPAVDVELTAAVVAHVNAGSYSQPEIAAERAYLPKWTLGETETQRVPVVCLGIDVTGADRAQDHHDYTVQLGLLKKLEGNPVAEPTLVDPWRLVVQELLDRLRRQNFTLDSGERAEILRVTVAAPFDAKFLDENNQFASVLTLLYRVTR